MRKPRSDLLVLGGGMAGMAAAAKAVESGARVTVVEKLAQAGGSAALSAGILWTAPDSDTLRRVIPGGDAALGRALVEGFRPAVEWVRSNGVSVSELWEGQFGFGTACRVDMDALFATWQQRIASGGEIHFRTAAKRLLVNRSGKVEGAAVAGPDGVEEFEAAAVLLATGGFQGDPELVKTFIGGQADSMLLRSNPGSVGDGFRLGTAAGASASRCLGAFYGHLVPSPMPEFKVKHYLSLTQYHSKHCLLVNRLGRRFTDESLGDEVSNQATLGQPCARAVLLFDHRVRTEHAAAAPYPHGQVVDRVGPAAALGARVAQAESLEQLVLEVAGWGVAAGALRQTIGSSTRTAASGEIGLDGLPSRPHVLVEPPFYAMEVQPTITFPFGGVAVDVDGRVLDRDRNPVPGLFAAGADAGGLQDLRYVGGLALGAVFGPRAAMTALAMGRVTPQ